MVAVGHRLVRNDQPVLVIRGQIDDRTVCQTPPEGTDWIAEDGLLDDVESEA
jgi:hypothetical protein